MFSGRCFGTNKTVQSKVSVSDKTMTVKWLIVTKCKWQFKMDKKAVESGKGRTSGQVKRKDESPDLALKLPDLAELPSDLSFEELRNRFDSSAISSHMMKRDIASIPATHSSAMRQVVTGKVFKKCKSATFQIDGATYTIGE